MCELPELDEKKGELSVACGIAPLDFTGDTLELPDVPLAWLGVLDRQANDGLRFRRGLRFHLELGFELGFRLRHGPQLWRRGAGLWRRGEWVMRRGSRI